MTEGLRLDDRTPPIDWEALLDSGQDSPGAFAQIAVALDTFKGTIQGLLSGAGLGEDGRLEATQLEPARRFVLSTGLDRGLCRLVNELWDYVAWAEWDSFEEVNRLGLKGIAGHWRDSMGHFVVAFEFKGRRYILSLTEDGFMRADLPRKMRGATIELYHQRRTVFSLRVLQPERGARRSLWEPAEVEGLMAGSWISDMVELMARLAIVEARLGKEW